MRYAQTEVIEVSNSGGLATHPPSPSLPSQNNCDPQFFTTVVFYAGSVSLQTNIKFEVFDRHEAKVGVADISLWVWFMSCIQMCPIGQASCTVMEIIKSPETCCRLEITFDHAICGYLHIRAWKVGSVVSECVRE